MNRLPEKFSETVIVDLVKKSIDDAERTIQLVPWHQQYGVYFTVAAHMLSIAAAIHAKEQKIDKRTAMLSIARLVQKQFASEG